jgi:chorismate mutase
LANIVEPPTFYERRAFIDDFRRKWREDRGMVSLFDKRQMYKKAMGRVKSANENTLVKKGKSPV